MLVIIKTKDSTWTFDVMKQRYQGRLDKRIMANLYWNLKRDRYTKHSVKLNKRYLLPLLAITLNIRHYLKNRVLFHTNVDLSSNLHICSVQNQIKTFLCRIFYLREEKLKLKVENGCYV